LQHPDIVQAYVVGVPDQSKGEIVAAVVELRAGAAVDTASVNRRLLPRAAGNLQGTGAARISHGRGTSANADRQDP
jgi:acyl-coenzyme A synthetase/AMP-(fatty) acid ligase